MVDQCPVQHTSKPLEHADVPLLEHSQVGIIQNYLLEADLFAVVRVPICQIRLQLGWNDLVLFFQFPVHNNWINHFYNIHAYTLNFVIDYFSLYLIISITSYDLQKIFGWTKIHTNSTILQTHWQSDIQLLPEIHFDMLYFKCIYFYYTIESTCNNNKLISLIAHEK